MKSEKRGNSEKAVALIVVVSFVFLQVMPSGFSATTSQNIAPEPSASNAPVVSADSVPVNTASASSASVANPATQTSIAFLSGNVTLAPSTGATITSNFVGPVNPATASISTTSTTNSVTATTTNNVSNSASAVPAGQTTASADPNQAILDQISVEQKKLDQLKTEQASLLVAAANAEKEVNDWSGLVSLYRGYANTEQTSINNINAVIQSYQSQIDQKNTRITAITNELAVWQAKKTQAAKELADPKFNHKNQSRINLAAAEAAIAKLKAERQALNAAIPVLQKNIANKQKELTTPTSRLQYFNQKIAECQQQADVYGAVAAQKKAAAQPYVALITASETRLKQLQEPLRQQLLSYLSQYFEALDNFKAARASLLKDVANYPAIANIPSEAEIRSNFIWDILTQENYLGAIHGFEFIREEARLEAAGTSSYDYYAAKMYSWKLADDLAPFGLDKAINLTDPGIGNLSNIRNLSYDEVKALADRVKRIYGDDLTTYFASMKSRDETFKAGALKFLDDAKQKIGELKSKIAERQALIAYVNNYNSARNDFLTHRTATQQAVFQQSPNLFPLTYVTTGGKYQVMDPTSIQMAWATATFSDDPETSAFYVNLIKAFYSLKSYGHGDVSDFFAFSSGLGRLPPSKTFLAQFGLDQFVSVNASAVAAGNLQGMSLTQLQSLVAPLKQVTGDDPTAYFSNAKSKDDAFQTNALKFMNDVQQRVNELKTTVPADVKAYANELNSKMGGTIIVDIVRKDSLTCSVTVKLDPRFTSETKAPGTFAEMNFDISFGTGSVWMVSQKNVTPANPSMHVYYYKGDGTYSEVGHPEAFIQFVAFHFNGFDDDNHTFIVGKNPDGTLISVTQANSYRYPDKVTNPATAMDVLVGLMKGRFDTGNFRENGGNFTLGEAFDPYAGAKITNTNPTTMHIPSDGQGWIYTHFYGTFGAYPKVASTVTPQAQQHYVDQLKAQLGSGSSVTTKLQADGSLLVTVAGGLGNFTQLSFKLDGKGNVVKESVTATYKNGSATWSLSSQNLFKSLQTLPYVLGMQVQAPTDPNDPLIYSLAKMTLCEITKIDADGTIHFKIGSTLLVCSAIGALKKESTVVTTSATVASVTPVTASVVPVVPTQSAVVASSTATATPASSSVTTTPATVTPSPTVQATPAVMQAIAATVQAYVDELKQKINITGFTYTIERQADGVYLITVTNGKAVAGMLHKMSFKLDAMGIQMTFQEAYYYGTNGQSSKVNAILFQEVCSIDPNFYAVFNGPAKRTMDMTALANMAKLTLGGPTDFQSTGKNYTFTLNGKKYSPYFDSKGVHVLDETTAQTILYAYMKWGAKDKDYFAWNLPIVKAGPPPAWLVNLAKQLAPMTTEMIRAAIQMLVVKKGPYELY